MSTLATFSEKWIPKSFFFKLWNFWPPFFGAGVQILEVSENYRKLRVRLKYRWWNHNYVGTQFGGSMFSMTDPFYMVMLLQNLGRGYIVWDKAASIRYLKPGKSELFVDFELKEEALFSIRKTLESQEKMDWMTAIQVKNSAGEIVAEVEKVLSIRKKAPRPVTI